MQELPPELLDQVLLYLTHLERGTCYQASRVFHVLSKSTIIDMLKEHVPYHGGPIPLYVKPEHMVKNMYVEFFLCEDRLTIFFDHLSFDETESLLCSWVLRKLVEIKKTCIDMFDDDTKRLSFRSCAHFLQVLKEYGAIMKTKVMNNENPDYTFINCDNCGRRVFNLLSELHMIHGLGRTGRYPWLAEDSLIKDRLIMSCNLCIEYHDICPDCIQYCCEEKCMHYSPKGNCSHAYALRYCKYQE